MLPGSTCVLSVWFALPCASRVQVQDDLYSLWKIQNIKHKSIKKFNLNKINCLRCIRGSCPPRGALIASAISSSSVFVEASGALSRCLRLKQRYSPLISFLSLSSRCTSRDQVAGWSGAADWSLVTLGEVGVYAGDLPSGLTTVDWSTGASNALAVEPKENP